MAVTKITADFIDADAVETTQIKDANVTTAKIADNAITLAKLASGTDGEIITYDASGDPTTLAVGTVQGTNTSTLFHSGEFLQTGGAGAEPTWKVPLVSKYYEEQHASTLAADTLYTFTHNLGAMPKMVDICFVCTSTDAGFAVGEEVPVLGPAGSVADRGMVFVKTSTTIKVTTSAAIETIDPTSKNTSSFTASKWDIIVRAWV